MDSFKITYFDLAVMGAILGYVLGFVPLIFGIVRRKVVLGILGLVASVIVGAIGSFILALPTVAIFVWLITRDRAMADAAPGKDLADDSNNS